MKRKEKPKLKLSLEWCPSAFEYAGIYKEEIYRDKSIKIEGANTPPNSNTQPRNAALAAERGQILAIGPGSGGVCFSMCPLSLYPLGF